MTEVSLNVPRDHFQAACQLQQQQADRAIPLQQQFQKQCDRPSPNIDRICQGEVFVPAGTSSAKLGDFLSRQP